MYIDQSRGEQSIIFTLLPVGIGGIPGTGILIFPILEV